MFAIAVSDLTHSGLVTPSVFFWWWCQAITWISAALLSIGPHGINLKKNDKKSILIMVMVVVKVMMISTKCIWKYRPHGTNFRKIYPKYNNNINDNNDSDDNNNNYINDNLNKMHLKMFPNNILFRCQCVNFAFCMWEAPAVPEFHWSQGAWVDHGVLDPIYQGYWRTSRTRRAAGWPQEWTGWLTIGMLNLYQEA